MKRRSSSLLTQGRYLPGEVDILSKKILAGEGVAGAVVAGVAGEAAEVY
jgi:hypothetical protein